MPVNQNFKPSVTNNKPLAQEDRLVDKNNKQKESFSNKKNATLLGVIATLLGVIATLIVYIAAISRNDSNSVKTEMIGKVDAINKEILALKETSSSLEKRVKNQQNEIDNLKRNLLFIYTRTDYSTISDWQRSLKEHKNEAERDLR